MKVADAHEPDVYPTLQDYKHKASTDKTQLHPDDLKAIGPNHQDPNSVNVDHHTITVVHRVTTGPQCSLWTGRTSPAIRIYQPPPLLPSLRREMGKDSITP